MVGVRVLMEPILSLHYVAEISLSLRYTPLKSGIFLARKTEFFIKNRHKMRYLVPKMMIAELM